MRVRKDFTLRQGRNKMNNVCVFSRYYTSELKLSLTEPSIHDQIMRDDQYGKRKNVRKLVRSVGIGGSMMRKRKPGISDTEIFALRSSWVLPCNSPKADPGLAIPSAPAANFLKLVSLELGRGLDADE